MHVWYLIYAVNHQKVLWIFETHNNLWCFLMVRCIKYLTFPKRTILPTWNFQGMIWNTFGPISESVLAVFCPEWTEATLALLGNWGNIMYIVPIVPVIWDHTQLNLKGIFNNVFDRVLLCRVHSGKTIENLIEIPIEIQLNCAPQVLRGQGPQGLHRPHRPTHVGRHAA